MHFTQKQWGSGSFPGFGGPWAQTFSPITPEAQSPLPQTLLAAPTPVLPAPGSLFLACLVPLSALPLLHHCTEKPLQKTCAAWFIVFSFAQSFGSANTS